MGLPAARPVSASSDNFPGLGRAGYDGAVFGVAGRRAAEVLVGLFALLGFVCVPLGQKTGLQHLIAIGSTPPVTEAVNELWNAAQRARERVSGAFAGEPTKVPGPPPSGNPLPKVPKLGSR